MKPFGYILILLNLNFFLMPQEKYIVYFKDKEIKNISLLKSGQVDSLMRSTLSERAINRRMKCAGNKAAFTNEDIPVSEEYIRSVEKCGAKILYKLKWLNAVSVTCSDAQKDQIAGLSCCLRVDKTAGLSSTRLQYLNHKKDFTSVPISLKTGSANWRKQLAICEIPQVHDLGITGAGVLIGMLDSGFDWRTPDALKTRKVIAEYDFVQKDSLTYDQAGDPPGQDAHGTFVFSLIGGFRDSTMVGAAYNAGFLLAKTENEWSETNAEEDYYAAALEWMDSAGVDMTTGSVGYNIFDKGQRSYSYHEMNGNTAVITRALNAAFDRGILTFTSAGNEGDDDWYHIIAPADAYNVLAVGAVGADGITTAFSSRGPTSDGRIKPDLMALGVGVFGAASKAANEYYSDNGTSSAAPVAAGAGALLLSAHQYLTNSQARQMLIQTSQYYPSPNNTRGYGLVSALKAVMFPGLEKNGALWKIHKVVNTVDTQQGSSYFCISMGGTGYTSIKMEETTKNHLVCVIPDEFHNKGCSFYFSYKSKDGTPVRDPLSGAYYTADWNKIGSLSTSSWVAYMDQNFPNPFNEYTTITFNNPYSTEIKLEVYNSIGQKIKTLVSGLSEKGLNLVSWDGKNSEGKKVPSGVYFYKLESINRLSVKKMILLR